MAKFLLNLPDQTLCDLRERSAVTNTSVSQTIREAIHLFLNQQAVCGIVMSGGIVASGTAFFVSVR
jgi:hypothetical protein